MNKYVKQHHAITEARYDLSAIEKNMFYLLLGALKDDDPPEKEYLVDISKSPVLKDVPLEELRHAARNLLSRPYYINKPNGNILAVTLMTRVSYDETTALLGIVVARQMLPYLIDLKNDYTEFELDIALSLKSKYSKRIYEMLSHHKDAGIMHITVDELKYRLALKDPKKKKETYTWTPFKEVVLETAKKELQEHADITFTYDAKKTGNKYTDLTFHITRSENFRSNEAKASSSS